MRINSAMANNNFGGAGTFDRNAFRASGRRDELVESNHLVMAWDKAFCTVSICPALRMSMAREVSKETDEQMNEEGCFYSTKEDGI